MRFIGSPDTHTHMSTLLPHSAVGVSALLLLLFVCVPTTADTILKNGDEFENIEYSKAITFDANAKLKDETSYSSTILWKDCTVSNTVTVKGTFDTAKTFATSLYLMVERATFTGVGQFDFFDLPPNSYIHAAGTTATGVTKTVYNIRPTTETNNITTLIDDSTITYESGDVVFVDLKVPLGSPYIVTHIHNAKLTNTYAIFQTTTCNDGSTIFLEKITCTQCRWDLTWLREVSSISKQSALILKEITIVDHTRPTRDGLIVTGEAVEVDETSVLAMIDIDLTNNFQAAVPLRLFYKTQFNGTGAIVLLRIKMGASGLLDGIEPSDNTNFWVVAMNSTSGEMTPDELRDVNFNVNPDNVIHWDGTGSDGKCVEAGLALPNTATYELVGDKCEATCPQGNFLPPACTPRAVCTGVPNCEACYAHPKTLCLECLPHTNAINGDTGCKCPIPDCVSCPTPTLCSTCSEGYKFSPEDNSCFRCTIDLCTVCREDDKCTTCEDGYKVHNNQCVACTVDKCESCKEPGNCVDCIAEHKPTSNGKSCFHCTIPSCKECSADGVCKECIDGYWLEDNTCIRCSIDVEKCKSCKTDGVCHECIAEHKTANAGTSCFHCTIPNCVECSADGVCGDCLDGYSLVTSPTPTDNKCVRCSMDIEKCKSCETDSVCTDCIADHKPANDGKDCFHCTIPGCKECSADGVCKKCIDGYWLEDNTCIRCSIDVEKCKSCKTDGICHECIAEHKTANAGTSCFHCTIPFCSECSADGVCRECDGGYWLEDNKCIRCSIDIEKCKSCKTDGVCHECIDEHKPTNEGKDCFHCTIPGCKECSADGVCGDCIDGYSLVTSPTPTDNKCVRCSIDVPNCDRCVIDGVCSECIADHKVSPNGLRCTQCKVDECQRCDLPGICVLCKDGIAVNGAGQCTLCAIEDCTYCSGDNKCGMCICGMVPSEDGKSCVLCETANCKYCDPSGGGTKCSECHDGYEVSGEGICNKIGLPEWVVFIIVLVVTIVLVTAGIVAYILYLRHLAKLAQIAADAEERRMNRQAVGKAGRAQRMNIAVLDIGDIEGAASGIRDNVK